MPQLKKRELTAEEHLIFKKPCPPSPKPGIGAPVPMWKRLAFPGVFLPIPAWQEWPPLMKFGMAPAHRGGPRQRRR